MDENTAGIKTNGRSRGEMVSDITTDTKLKVGAIAIGNGGGSVGTALYREGFDVIFINTSIKDLDSVVIPSTCKAFLIDDKSGLARGAGRNRGTMLDLYQEWDKDTLFKNEEFEDFVEGKDVIFLIATTAGGTGSGLTPTLVDNLLTVYPGKVFIPVGILPKLSESVKCQLNTEQFISEIDQLVTENSISYMIFDLDRYKDLTLDDCYKKTANDIVDAVSVIAGSLARITKHGMIDERDLLTIITAPGLLNVYSCKDVELSEIDNDGIQSIIIKNIKNTSAVQPQRDKIVEYYGVYLDIQEESNDPIVKGEYSQLEETFGKPLDVFVNYATNDSSISQFALIVSGLSTPMDRLNLSIREAEKYQRRKTKELNIQNIDNAYDVDNNKQIDKIMNSASKTKNDVELNTNRFRGRRK